MKKKILAVFLSLCMAMSLLPVTALATETTATPIQATDTTLASGDYVLPSDIALSSGALTIAKDATVTIDLAGHTLTNAANNHTIVNNGTLTVYDSGTTGTIISNAAGHSALQNEPEAIATIESGKLYKTNNTSSNDYYVITNHGELTINGGTIVSDSSHSSAIENGWYTPSQNTGRNYAFLTINDGEVGSPNASGGLYTLKNDDYGIMEIRDGTFTNSTSGAGTVLNWNELTIYGGNFTATTSAVATMAEGTAGNPTYEYERGTTTIFGGNFEGILGTNTQYSAAISVVLYGGTFKENVENLCATGYAATEQDGKYVVGPKTDGMEASAEKNGTTSSAEVGGEFTFSQEDQDGVSSDASGSKIAIDVTTGNSSDEQPAPDADVTNTTVNIAPGSLTSVRDADVETIEIATDVGTVTLDKQAWNTITKKATLEETESSITISSVTLSLQKNTDSSKTSWEVTAETSEGDAFSGENLAGTITISVNYDATINEGDTVEVYCIDNGGMENMNAAYNKDENTLTWTTKHLSTFAAVVLNEETEAIWSVDGETPTSDSGTLAEAIAAFTDGTTGTITLQKDVVADNSSINDATQSVYKIPNGVTLDGNNKTIKASEKWKGDSGRTTNHILSVESNGGTDTAQTTIKNLTIIGTKTSKSGIHAYNGANVKLDNVTIQNCGSVGVQINGAKVEATGLNISGSGWGSINVDKGTNVTTAAALKFNSGKLEDDVQIYSEDDSNSIITATGLTKVNGGDGALDEKTYYTDDVTKLGEAVNTSTNTVYEDLDTALSEANSGNTVQVVKDATANGPNTSVKEGVTLVVNPGVTLSGTLTNNGTIENNGTISATITGKTESVTSTVTFKVSPANATVAVKDASGKNVTGTNNVYQLPNGNYTYTVSANGYFSESGTITVSGKVQTISVALSKVPPANPDYRIDIPAAEGGTVTADPAAAKAGATVTLTATPDEGYAVGTITVTDRFGDAVKVTENADGTYTFTMPNGQVTVKATFVETEEPAPAEPFPDVDENDWFYDEVVYVYENGLMNGVENNQFAPNTATNRAMLATILYRLAGEPAVSGDLPFTDVAAGTWYTDAVLWAAQNGIVNGLGENTFAPMNTLTREQLVTMLYRYAEAAGYDVSAAADLSGYPDADKVQTYAQKAMSWAVAEGIVEGMDGNLNPAGSATRAQIATILMRFCEGVAK